MDPPLLNLFFTLLSEKVYALYRLKYLGLKNSDNYLNMEMNVLLKNHSDHKIGSYV